MAEFLPQKDEDLMESYIFGNESALEFVIKNNLSLVYSTVYFMVGDSHNAEDITQETFLKLWKYAKKYKRGQSFRPWLLTIARNTALDFLRKKKNLVFSDFENDTGENLFADRLVSPELLADEIFSQMENKKMLDEVLAKLSVPQREVIALRYSSNMTFDEIGKIVGRPLDTVKSQHRRALLEMKKHLKDRQ